MGKGSSGIFIKCICMYVCCNREHSCLICMGLQPMQVSYRNRTLPLSHQDMDQFSKLQLSVQKGAS